MEKRTPHYNLADVQVVVADQTSRPFTATALRGGLDLGLTETEMRVVVLLTGPQSFSLRQSEVNYEMPGMWPSEDGY